MSDRVFQAQATNRAVTVNVGTYEERAAWAACEVAGKRIEKLSKQLRAAIAAQEKAWDRWQKITAAEPYVPPEEKR